MLFETDPVCKMQVMPETAAAKYDYKGRTYYFCATRCMERFKNPERFPSPHPIRNQIEFISSYTCPMHPEVHQLGPGLRKCGMALEPEVASKTKRTGTNRHDAPLLDRRGVNHASIPRECSRSHH
jgi:Cu+-exporting ATPase